MILLFSSMEMDAQTPIRRRGILKHLYQRIKDYESFFLSPSDLQGLGIQAFQVGITDDGVLQFHPCFFRPHPERVLQKYPLDTSEMIDGFPKLNYRPDFDSILSRVLVNCPNTEDPLALARMFYDDAMELTSLDEWDSRAREIWYYIDSQSDSPRKGLLSPFIDLARLRIWR
jgi:hypothetical protein